MRRGQGPPHRELKLGKSYSALAPGGFRAGVQRATSLSTSFCRASGVRSVLLGITPPSSSRRFLVFSSSRDFMRASLSFLTTSGGVPLGANIAFQALTSYPSRPASLVVGTFGSTGERCG